jgi:type III restriction enzyme
LEKYHGQIKLLGDARQAVYDDIRGQAREPELTPTELRTNQRVEGGTAEGEKLPRYPKHVLADGEGQWPLDPKFTSWEKDVLAQELDRSSVVAWYRNPSDAGKHSIRVPYRKDGLWKSLQPDFIFFDTNAGGQIVPSIVDPHSGSFTGALERLEGLARYAEEHGAVYARIDAIDEGRDKTLRSLDLKDPAVRAAILAAEKDGKSAADLFNGPQSRAY